MRRTTRTWRTTAAMFALAALLATPAVWADRLDEAEIFIEINDTDGDAGIQIFLDAEGWQHMQVVDPDGNIIVHIDPRNSGEIQGFTEAFFESAEPSFDDQPLGDFLALWPEGYYRFRGRTKPDDDGESVPLRGRALLTHALPGAPILVRPVEGDDQVDPDDTVIEWALVADPPGSRIVSYEVIVETDDDDVPFRDLKVLVGAKTTSITVPPEFMMPGTAYKFEVLAREASGNQTIAEREFETEGDGNGGDDDDDDDDDDDE